MELGLPACKIHALSWSEPQWLYKHKNDCTNNNLCPPGSTLVTEEVLVSLSSLFLLLWSLHRIGNGHETTARVNPEVTSRDTCHVMSLPQALGQREMRLYACFFVCHPLLICDCQAVLEHCVPNINSDSKQNPDENAFICRLPKSHLKADEQDSRIQLLPLVWKNFAHDSSHKPLTPWLASQSMCLLEPDVTHLQSHFDSNPTVTNESCAPKKQPLSSWWWHCCQVPHHCTSCSVPGGPPRVGMGHKNVSKILVPQILRLGPLLN